MRRMDMRAKKFASVVLAIIMTAVFCGNVFAMALFTAEPKEKVIKKITGTVSYVDVTDKLYKIGIEDADGAAFTLVTDAESYNAGLTAPDQAAPGDSFVAWYDSSAPTVRIFPPQYRSVVYQIGEADMVSAVDYFDLNEKGDMLSQSGDLVLLMENFSGVVDKDGNALDGPAFDGKLLVVYSDVILESFPAQTAPKKIVALEYKTAGQGDTSAETVEPGVYVNGLKVADEPLFRQAPDVVMVPLRAVAEALGCIVHWEEDMNAVVLNNNTMVYIGETSYAVGRMAPIELSDYPAPLLIDGRTWVTTEFFTQVLDYGVKVEETGDGSWRVDIETIYRNPVVTDPVPSEK
jgi:hypothetical protein